MKGKVESNCADRYCRHCGDFYYYFPGIDPSYAARYCSPDCFNCVAAGKDASGKLLAPCQKHDREEVPNDQD